MQRIKVVGIRVFFIILLSVINQLGVFSGQLDSNTFAIKQAPILTTNNAEVILTITESAIDPSSVTVDLGTDIVWVNSTDTIQILQSGDPQYQLFLPVAMASSAISNRQIVNQGNPSSNGGFEDFTATLLPGESVRYTFTQLGSYTFYLRTNPDIFGTISVAEVADSGLTLAPIGDRTASLGQTLSFSVSAAYQGSESLVFDIAPLPLPDNATFNPTNGLFEFTPEESQIGTYNIAFSVTDGVLVDSETVQITVPVPNSTDETRLRGRIMDANDAANGISTPLSGATITNIETGVATTTDQDGYFTLRQPNSWQ